MKKILPKSDNPITISTTLPKRRRIFEFPSIYRFITERVVTSTNLYYTKLFLASFVSWLLVLNILSQGVMLNHNLKEVQNLKQERAHLTAEVAYWKQVTDKYRNYRDVYFRIATLEYRLGDIDGAKAYVKKALRLDPNFKDGRVLGIKIGA